jgi:hypothetical protein
MAKRKWLEGKSWHIIRDEMLLSPAWKAASHLQRSMILALLSELGRHGGKDNGHLIFTNRNLRRFGFSFDAIARNLIAIEALGFISFKRGRPGLRGYGKARRFRITFLPILDADGNEIEPPTDEWARFTTTKEAKMAVQRARKRGQSSKNRSRNRITSVVIQKSDHVADKHNRQLNAEKPMNIEPAESEIGSLSISANQSPIGDATYGPFTEWHGVGLGRYTISTDPAALKEFSMATQARFPLIKLAAVA